MITKTWCVFQVQDRSTEQSDESILTSLAREQLKAVKKDPLEFVQEITKVSAGHYCCNPGTYKEENYDMNIVEVIKKLVLLIKYVYHHYARFFLLSRHIEAKKIPCQGKHTVF